MSFGCVVRNEPGSLGLCVVSLVRAHTRKTAVPDVHMVNCFVSGSLCWAAALSVRMVDDMRIHEVRRIEFGKS